MTKPSQYIIIFLLFYTNICWGYIITDSTYGVADSKDSEDPDYIPYSWENVENGQVLDLDDDQLFGPVEIGFGFRFYNKTYNELYISSNGLIVFDSPLYNGCCSPEHIPQIDQKNNGFIAFAWSDLNPSLAGNITTITEGNYPERKFILTIEDLPHQGGASSWPISVQVILYEKNGNITISYKSDGDYPYPVAIGIDAPEGEDGIEYYYGSLNRVELNETIIKFSFIDNELLIFPLASYSLNEGSSIQVGIRVYQSEPHDVEIIWDTDDDGNYNENVGNTLLNVDASNIDGPDNINFSVMAMDNTINKIAFYDFNIPVLNLPPQFKSTPNTQVAAGSQFIYNIEVTDMDPVTINFIDNPDEMIIDENTVQWTVPADAQEGDYWYVSLLALDDDGGSTEQNFNINVANEDELPDPPIPIYPDNVVVPISQPELIVGNVEVDGEALYYFEIDTTDQFNSENKLFSDGINPGQNNQTSWKVPEKLENNTNYYWRSWIEDSRGIGKPVVSNFSVILTDENQNDSSAGCSCKAANNVNSLNIGKLHLLFTLYNIILDL